MKVLLLVLFCLVSLSCSTLERGPLILGNVPMPLGKMQEGRVYKDPKGRFAVPCPAPRAAPSVRGKSGVQMNLPMVRIILVLALAIGLESAHAQIADRPAPHPGVDFVLDRAKTHTKFSSTIPPAITVPSGSVIEVYTHEATGGQLNIESKTAELAALDMDRIHTLAGPVYVEDAMPGDVLAVTLLEIEPGNWGWMGIIPGLGLLADEFPEPMLTTFSLDHAIEFAPGIRVPLSPFAGVMGVAPASSEQLSTIPPRASLARLWLTECVSIKSQSPIGHFHRTII